MTDPHAEAQRRLDAMSGDEIAAFVGEFADEDAGMELLREQILAQVREDECHPDHITYIGRGA